METIGGSSRRAHDYRDPDFVICRPPEPYERRNTVARNCEPLCVGLVGAGAVGQMHIAALAGVEASKVVALADLRPQLAAIVAQRFRVPRVYRSHIELLDDPLVNAVVVVTRRNATSTVVLDCLEAGKHVLSEKPMAMTAAEAEKLAAAAERNGVQYAIAFQKRCDPGTHLFRARLLRYLETTELGALVLMRVWNHTGKDRVLDDERIVMTEEQRPTGLSLGPQAPDWLPPKFHHSYDRFVNAFSHDVNVLHYVLQESPAVRAAELEFAGGQAAILRYPDFLCLLECSLGELNDWSSRGNWDEGLEALFEGGRLSIRFPPPLYCGRCARVELTVADRNTEVLCDGALEGSLFSLQAREFVTDIMERTEPAASGRRCLRDMRLIEEIWSVGVGRQATGGIGLSPHRRE